MIDTRHLALLALCAAALAAGADAQSPRHPAIAHRLNPPAGVAAGKLEAYVLRDSTYERDRRIWIYTPPGYAAAGGAGYDLLVAFDGDEYRDAVPLPMILDTLLAGHHAPPFVALLIDDGASAERLGDLANRAPMATFLSHQLIPWVRTHYNVTRDPHRTIVTGSSAGGLASAFVAFKRPDLFGNVLSQSGAFWRGREASNNAPHEWLTAQFAAASREDITLFLDVGDAETRPTLGGSGPVFIEAHRRFRDALRRKGYAVTYAEVPGGQHSPESWKVRLGAGIVALTEGWIPPVPSARTRALVGEYGSDSAVRIVFERDGQLFVHWNSGAESALVNSSGDTLSGVLSQRRRLGPESGNQLLVPPLRPIPELRREALAASPPAEAGPFRTSDLVELTTLDPTIKLEIRYATSNNLFGTPFYTQARAFMQREPAEALVRANAALRARGYGLLIHDGYRPWYVTKMFWDASPDDKHLFVADPVQGSRHNRGAAVDLTLYDRATGTPVEMVSTYDETTDRAAADYPGGTTRQRWHRALLRHAMEAEQFMVNPTEWWHFDYADWRQYPIGNVDFQMLTSHR